MLFSMATSFSDAALSDASGSLDLVRAAAPVVALLVVVLIWLGVQPTLSRYRLAAA